MGASVLHARDLVERLWQQTQAQAQAFESAVESLDDAEPLARSDELRYLNARWRLDVPTSLPSVGPRWKHRLKERVANIVIHLLDRYFADEQSFLAHVVRFDNKLAESNDRLAEELRELVELVRQESRRLAERDEVMHRLLEERVERLEHELAART